MSSGKTGSVPVTTTTATASPSCLELKGQTLGFRSYLKTSNYSKLTLEYHHINEYRRGGNLLNRPPHEADIAEQLNHSINGGGLSYSLLLPTRNTVSISTLRPSISTATAITARSRTSMPMARPAT